MNNNICPNMAMPNGSSPLMPQSRYILPEFEERTAYGYKRQPLF